MIDLRRGLGAPPIVFPGLPMRHASVPPGTPGNAPLMPVNVAGQNALGCAGCSQNGGIGDLRSWFDKIPLWVKIGVGVVMLTGVGYGVYRLVR